MDNYARWVIYKERKWKSLISSYGSVIEEEINQAIDYYKNLIHKRHAHKIHHYFYAAAGEKNRKNLVISYCPIDNESMYPLYYRSMLECTGESNCKLIFDNLDYD